MGGGVYWTCAVGTPAQGLACALATTRSLESITSLVNLSACSCSLPVGRVSTTNSCRGAKSLYKGCNEWEKKVACPVLFRTEAHLLNGVVLTDLGGNLLCHWTVLHLGEMLLLTDWAISTSGPGLQTEISACSTNNVRWRAVCRASWHPKQLCSQAEFIIRARTNYRCTQNTGAHDPTQANF